MRYTHCRMPVRGSARRRVRPPSVWDVFPPAVVLSCERGSCGRGRDPWPAFVHARPSRDALVCRRWRMPSESLRFIDHDNSIMGSHMSGRHENLAMAEAYGDWKLEQGGTARPRERSQDAPGESGRPCRLPASRAGGDGRHPRVPLRSQQVRLSHHLRVRVVPGRARGPLAGGRPPDLLLRAHHAAHTPQGALPRPHLPALHWL